MFTKSRKCPLFICMFWSSFFSPPQRLFHEYNTAFSLFFVVFFLIFARLSASKERNHSTWGRNGEKRKEERNKGDGLHTAPDMPSPIFVHRWQVIGCISSLSGLCCCQESMEEAEKGRVDLGQLVGSRVERVRRVKRSSVSPGSLCHSLDPAVRSCSSSSLSAGCTAARWCLGWTWGTKGGNSQSHCYLMWSHLIMHLNLSFFHVRKNTGFGYDGAQMWHSEWKCLDI